MGFYFQYIGLVFLVGLPVTNFFFFQILVQNFFWASFFWLEGRTNKFFYFFYLRVFLIFFKRVNK